MTDPASGDEFTLDGSSDVPTTNGGTWALGDGHLLHATIRKRSYCIASVDLATRTSTLGWCAPARHGFTDARISSAGDSLTTFDDSRPSCRTVARLDGTCTEPFPGVPDCHGSEGAHRGRRGLVRGPQRTPDREPHFYACAEGRGLLRPRPRKHRHPRLVRGRPTSAATLSEGWTTPP